MPINGLPRCYKLQTFAGRALKGPAYENVAFICVPRHDESNQYNRDVCWSIACLRHKKKHGLNEEVPSAYYLLHKVSLLQNERSAWFEFDWT